MNRRQSCPLCLFCDGWALEEESRINEQPERRQTLIAKRCEVEGKLAYRFDIRIQGDGETVFFDF